MTDPVITRSPGHRRRLVVLSGLGNEPMAPRGQRTSHLIEALRDDWSIELISFPEGDGAGSAAGSGRAGLLDGLRPLAGRVARSIFYDPREPWSARRFARWEPQADAAVLVAAPWSPLAWGGRRLRAAGVPYVLDVGDPWALTSLKKSHNLAAWRASRDERPLWQGAVGAIVTTPQQGNALAALFPHLELLVRPNGYGPVSVGDVPDRNRRDPSTLRLVHFGLIYSARLDVMPMLTRLRDSGRWQGISFTQYGDCHGGMLDEVPPGIEVIRHQAIPWSRVIESVGDFDAAVVLGNLTGDLLPSKAIQYLTLPIPRIAITDTRRDDALADFVSGRQAWLAISPDDPEAPAAVAGLVDRHWSADELKAPEDDSWPVVAGQLGAFVNHCLTR